MGRGLTKFNTENCDIRTQLMFEDWATIPCFKIITLLLARKGKSVFSAQGIGEMLEIPKSTVIHNLKLLRKNEYIVREGTHYYLNMGFGIDQPIGQSTNTLVESTNPLVKVDQPIGRESTNPLVANNDKEIIIKNNDKENGGTPSPKSKFLEVAEKALVPKDDPKLQTDNVFINTGRRPIAKYPKIKVAIHELIDVLETYETMGIPIDERNLHHLAFKTVQARLQTYEQEGKPTKNVSAYGWLTGWAMHETLDAIRKSNYLRKSEAA